MADNYRESRKEELRGRVMDGPEIAKKEKRSRSRRRRRQYLMLLLVLVPLCLLAGVIRWGLRRTLHTAEPGFVLEHGDGTVGADYEQYYPYADGLLRVTRDGAGYINSAGKSVWNQSYEMLNPYVSVQGEYVAIADQGKTGIYIMNTSGTTGRAETSLPIVKVSVSAYGVVYALLEDSDASFITVFTREGGALDISIKSVLSGDGYPVDLSVSEDGTELITSFVYLENGLVQNRVIFYNLSEVGQSSGGNRVVGGFTEDFRGHVAGRVRFSGNTEAQAFYDGGIAFFSTKVLTSPALLQNVDIPEAICAISYSGDYVGVITEVEDETVTEPYRLLVYKTNGQKQYERLFSMHYSGFTMDEARAIIFHEESLLYYDSKGRLRFQGNLSDPIQEAQVLSDNILGVNLMVGSEGRIFSVKLR